MAAEMPLGVTEVRAILEKLASDPAGVEGQMRAAGLLRTVDPDVLWQAMKDAGADDQAGDTSISGLVEGTLCRVPTTRKGHPSRIVTLSLVAYRLSLSADASGSALRIPDEACRILERAYVRHCRVPGVNHGFRPEGHLYPSAAIFTPRFCAMATMERLAEFSDDCLGDYFWDQFTPDGGDTVVARGAKVYLPVAITAEADYQRIGLRFFAANPLFDTRGATKADRSFISEAGTVLRAHGVPVAEIDVECRSLAGWYRRP